MLGNYVGKLIIYLPRITTPIIWTIGRDYNPQSMIETWHGDIPSVIRSVRNTSPWL